ncbi:MULTISPECIES: FMN-dependent NADH-azoreductase [Burkholderia]|uniref:FMN-dependent NADH-azoreductase n=1 Tax=Burkholderia TaxID=32008 RepID=UPI000B7AD730|nr:MULTISPECIES: NAD(P)H-dependent oxidoreductase [Burkholderia]MBY4725276.1 NAD(P)H-dependent oxidoreductase [Burkholderia contaminans]MCI3968442.1 NAD(P)H-dependent oxidoreductase [Burkholderia sp. HI4860]MDN7791280.1 NAD(P)H-dependent oxidoreductase [Burkholderia contaminans]OXI94739.1 FMN-dependent NADH-azoreductase [Burkholderia sp. AU33647]
MSRILLITSSPRSTDSLSTRFAHDLAQQLAARDAHSTVTLRDLSTDALPHIDDAYVVGRMLPPEVRNAEQAQAVELAQALVDELRAADIVVIGSAMTNFGPSTQLRAWFDRVIWPQVTFRYVEGGVAGTVEGKQVYLVTASGGIFSEGPYAPFDYQSGYLKHLLGFIGITDIREVRVEGTVLGAEAVQAAIAKAGQDVQALVEQAG